VSYKETYEAALRYGAWIKQKYGLRKDEVVSMDFVNSDVFVFVWFGIWSIGAKPAFINYNLTEKPLLHSIRTSGARVVLVDPKVTANFDDMVMTDLARPDFRSDNPGNVTVVVLDETVRREIANMPLKREPDSERAGQMLPDMAMLIYTSGTTGLPKPAVVSWWKAGLSGRFVGKFIGLRRDDILYTVRDLFLLTLEEKAQKWAGREC
jgi:acyl-CoA synthetase (AMP-forming)/AMP-acid ligase II